MVLFDSWLSSVAIGRSVATVAELSLMVQLSFYLRELASTTGVVAARRISYLIVPLIAVAETCSWYAVISTNYLGNTCEESIWTLSACLLIVGFALVYGAVKLQTRVFLKRGLVLGVGYILFMSRVDVPMYFHRWRADELAHRAYLPLGDGIRDVAFRWVATRNVGEWRTEMPWMGLYFTFAVWMSLSLIRAPSAQERS